jgi:type I restriction enzyme, R subunit
MAIINHRLNDGRRSLYDNLNQDEDLALRIDHAVRYTKKEGWVGNRFKEREITKVVREAAAGYNVNLEDVINLVKNQLEYVLCTNWFIS